MSSSKSTEVPQDTETLALSPIVRGLSLTLCGISIVTGTCLAVWTYQNRHARVVRASQPFFLYLLCVGSIVTVSSIIPHTMDPSVASYKGTTIACNAFLWLIAMGWSISLASLQAKLSRINQIMNSANHFKRVKISVWDAAKPIAVFVVLVAIILTLMLALKPIELVVYNDIVVCGMSDRLQFLAPLGILLFGLLCLVCWQAWKARNLASEFSESKSIFAMLMYMDLVIFICWPILVFNLGKPNVSVMLTSVVNYLMVSGLQGFLFLPKILHVKKEKQEGEEHQTIIVTGLDSNNEEAATMYTQSGQRRSTGTGELILTTKSQKELLQEVMTLQERLKAALQQCSRLQEENESLKDKMRNGEVSTIQKEEEGPNVSKGDATAETTETHDEVGPS